MKSVESLFGTMVLAAAAAFGIVFASTGFLLAEMPSWVVGVYLLFYCAVGISTSDGALQMRCLQACAALPLLSGGCLVVLVAIPDAAADGLKVILGRIMWVAVIGLPSLTSCEMASKILAKRR
jgi:hypothetical protein